MSKTHRSSTFPPHAFSTERKFKESSLESDREDYNLYLESIVSFSPEWFVMGRQMVLQLFEGVLLSLTKHNDISTPPSPYSVLKQKMPSMSPTYPIKRSTTQTMANPTVYFRAFFTCCNRRKKLTWSIQKIVFIIREARGSYSIQPRTIVSQCRSSLTWHR